MRSETSSDSNDYYWVRMTDTDLTDPCHQISMSDRFVGFYISQANPIASYDMSVQRGMTDGAIFFLSESGNQNAQWITSGWVQILSFDKSAGLDMLLDIDDGGSNSVKGTLHAQFCP